ncbi:MAG: hypothetical protein EB032_10315 [Betaproteobacteria bacterium]|nr:hypothetical protein [Betaproteobacteria bacterium]
MKLSRKIKTLAKKLAAFSGGRADAPACAAGEVNTDDECLWLHGDWALSAVSHTLCVNAPFF